MVNLQVEMHVYGTLPVQTDNELRGTIFMKTNLYYYMVQKQKMKDDGLMFCF